MEQMIKNDKHYVETKEYFIRYIKVLLNKKHIIEKEFLRRIKKDLISEGCISEHNKYKFLLGFLKSDRNHNNIKIKELLYSLESYSIQRKIVEPQTTLEEFF